MEKTAPPADSPARRRLRALGRAIPLSLLLHVLVLASAATGVLRFGCGRGPRGDDGENGTLGAGGPTTEISVEGPPAPPAAPPAPPPSPPAPPPAAAAPTPPEPEHTPTPPPTDTAALHVHHAPPQPSVAAHTEPQPSPPAPPPTPPVESHPGGGTGALATSGGRRPGSIGHQRSLLPRAAMCNDPVAGTWRALKYDPAYGDWFHVTLNIQRGEGDRLAGQMVARMWDGGPMDVRPPACSSVGFDFTVEMPGHGFIRGQRVDFGASTYRVRSIQCNSDLRPILYSPDHFTGTIDPTIQEFQSVNNDGGRAVNDPMVFRRVACAQGDDGAAARE